MSNFWSGAGGAAIGAVGQIIGNAQQSANIKAQIEAQKQENQKTREYNYMLAKQQNEWNIAQWNRENEYNSPANQMKRYSDAGLNPDLIYGQSNLSAQSPQLTSGAPGTPTDMSAISSKPTFASVVNSALNAYESTSRTALNRASENKLGRETQYLDGELKWQDIFNNTRYKSEHMNIELMLSDKNLKDEQKKLIAEQMNEIRARIPTYSAQIEELRAKVGVLNAQEAKTWAEKNLTDAQVQEVATRCNLNNAQARYIMEQTAIATLTKGMLAFDAQHQEARYYAEKDIQLQTLDNLKKQGLVLDATQNNLVYEGTIKEYEASKKQTMNNNAFLKAVDMTCDMLGKVNISYKGGNVTKTDKMISNGPVYTTAK